MVRRPASGAARTLAGRRASGQAGAAAAVRDLPARSPDAPALRSPFFFIMKLEPMKAEELSASIRPLVWSLTPSAAARPAPAAASIALAALLR